MQGEFATTKSYTPSCLLSGPMGGVALLPAAPHKCLREAPSPRIRPPTPPCLASRRWPLRYSCNHYPHPLGAPKPVARSSDPQGPPSPAGVPLQLIPDLGSAAPPWNLQGGVSTKPASPASGRWPAPRPGPWSWQRSGEQGRPAVSLAGPAQRLRRHPRWAERGLLPGQRVGPAACAPG